MIKITDNVTVKVIESNGKRKVVKGRNTIANEFIGVIENVLVNGSVNLYGYLGHSYIATTFNVPNGIAIVFLNNGVVTNMLPAVVQSASDNSIIFQVYDESTASYDFDSVELWTTFDNALLYKVAYSSFNSVISKTPGNFIEITWEIEWTLTSVFTIPNQLLNALSQAINQSQSNVQSQNYLPPNFIIPSNCQQTVMSALIFGLLGAPGSVNECMYTALYNIIQNGINGIGYIILFDANYNVVSTCVGNMCKVNPNTVPSYYIVTENVGGYYVPLFGGNLQVPIQPNTTQVLEVKIDVSA